MKSESNSVKQTIKTYNSIANELIPKYESVEFREVHNDLVSLLPILPASALDVGSGSGRDANALATLGYRVVAVEPSEKMLQWAKEHNDHENITWVDDSLPNLREVKALKKKFDLIMLSAVLMHLPTKDREQSFKELINMLSERGILYISISSGPKNDGRKFHNVSIEEMNCLSKENSLKCLLQKVTPDRFHRPDVNWIVSIYGREQC